MVTIPHQILVNMTAGLCLIPILKIQKQSCRSKLAEEYQNFQMPWIHSQFVLVGELAGICPLMQLAKTEWSTLGKNMFPASLICQPVVGRLWVRSLVYW